MFYKKPIATINMILNKRDMPIICHNLDLLIIDFANKVSNIIEIIKVNVIQLIS